MWVIKWRNVVNLCQYVIQSLFNHYLLFQMTKPRAEDAPGVLHLRRREANSVGNFWQDMKGWF